jgi:hypothetical protein
VDIVMIKFRKVYAVILLDGFYHGAWHRASTVRKIGFA